MLVWYNAPSHLQQGENFRSANEWFSKSFMYCKEHLGDKDIRTLQAACHVG